MNQNYQNYHFDCLVHNQRKKLKNYYLKHHITFEFYQLLPSQMETPLPPTFAFAVDKQQRSHIQCSYELFSFEPCRNSICFSNSYDESIVDIQINEKINFLKKLNLTFEGICDIRVTNYTWCFRYKGVFDENIIDKLIKEPQLVYFSVNDVIYKNDMMVDWIDSSIVKYYPMSFRQTDNNIKYKLYEIMKKNILSNKLYFIGGEMVFFAKLLNPADFIMYTDFESIYNDALINFPESSDKINMISYLSSNLKKTDLDFHLIANTSKHGLEKYLCNEIMKLGLKNITIISCNKRSFTSDYHILKSKYIIDKIYDITTNYSVCEIGRAHV